MFFFSKFHGFEKASVNTFSSLYALKTKSVKHCYIAIVAISMFEVPLVILKLPLL